MQVQPYLIFPGTCRDALELYAETFGGTLEHVQTVAESHLPAAPEHGDRIFHSVFVAGDLRFMASDGEVGKDPVMGQNFAMFLTCDDEEQQSRIFATLLEDGRMMFPLEGGFGMLEDRFGIRWMIGLGAS